MITLLFIVLRNKCSIKKQNSSNIYYAPKLQIKEIKEGPNWDPISEFGPSLFQL